MKQREKSFLRCRETTKDRKRRLGIDRAEMDGSRVDNKERGIRYLKKVVENGLREKFQNK